MTKLKISLLIFFILFCFSYAPVQAKSGCCSWHGGVSHCGSNGKYICNDGTESPSCSCISNHNSWDLTDSSNNSTTSENSINSSNSSDEVSKLEEKIDDLEEELEAKEKEAENYKKLFWTTIVIIAIYYITKKVKF